MSQVVPFRRATGLASQASPEFDLAVSLALNDAEFGELRSDKITVELRAEIVSRRDALVARLRPATWPERCAVLASLQSMPGRTEVDAELLEAFSRQETDDLEGAPHHALMIAARNFRRNEAADKRPFRPSVGELYQKALSIAAPDTRELQRLNKILAAKLLPAPSKTIDADRRREMAQKLRSDFSAKRAEVSLESALTAEIPFVRGGRPRSLAEEAAKAFPSAVPTELAEQLQQDADQRKRISAGVRHDEAVTALELQKGASIPQRSPEELAASCAKKSVTLSSAALRAIGFDCADERPASPDYASPDTQIAVGGPE